MNYSKSGIHKRQVALNARGPKWSRKFILLLVEAFFVVLIGGSIMFAAMGIGVFKSILATAPDVTTITVAPAKQSSFVYDSDGNQIYKLVSADSNRIPITYDKVTPNMEHAFVAIEDERFYEHNGIDIKGILRAGVKAIKDRSLGQGASTITQQLLKNNVFTDWLEEGSDIERVKRKVQEQYLAIQVEKNTDKQTIITNYLNTINLGQNTLGIQAASLRYFGKNCDELNLSECAVIAAITQNPSRFNPIIHPEENAKRRGDVLDKMLELKFITQDEYDEAVADDVYSRITPTSVVKGEQAVASYFVDALVDEVTQDLLDAGYSETSAYNLMYSGGIKIHSTMDSKIQDICDEEFANPENYPENTKWLLDYRLTVEKADGTLENHSSEMFKTYFKKFNAGFNMLYPTKEDAEAAILEYQEAVMGPTDEIFAESITITPQPQVSFTVEDQKTGYIVAMIGGRGAKEASRTFNRATQSTRQPGSCFKVLASFAPAIDACGKTLATTYNDAPFNYINGTPVSNWYGKDEYYGLCSLRYGIYYSLNVVAVKTITEITPELGFNYLQNFGFTTLESAKVIGDQIYTDIGQPLALGGITNGILNCELNSAYASIANGGVYIEPKLYTYIEDVDGNIILDNTTPVVHQTIRDTTAWLLTSAMQDCVNIGTGTRARVAGMSIAGKTGTTSDSKDVWFAGFSPYYTATCWSGYDNNVELSTAESRIPQTMFHAVMTRVHEELPDIGFERPAGIVTCAVCSKSGLLPNPGLCDGCIVNEYFTEDTLPTEQCNVHYTGRICPYDGLPATDLCPFAYEGTAEMIPPEHESLWQGSHVMDEGLDPLSVGANIVQNGRCHHNEAFFAQENWQAIIEQEQWELMNRGAGEQPAEEPSEENTEE